MTKVVDRFHDFSLLGLLASGYLAVLGSGYLDLPAAILAALGILIRGLMAARQTTLDVSNRTLTIATLAYVGFYPLDYFFLSRDFVRATVHLVFFLAVAKLLSAKTNRDFTYLKILALLELLAACVLSARPSFFLFLALFLFFGVLTLCSSEVRLSTQRKVSVVRLGMRRFSWRLAMLGVAIFTGILALTAGLFFLLPRTAQAAFQHLVPQRYHLAGFSNEVVLGQIGEIKLQDTPVMHVRMYGSQRLHNVKWRGSALTQFDGKKWFNAPGSGEMLPVQHGQIYLASPEQRRRRGLRIAYEVHLKDVASDTLFFAGTPEFLRIANSMVLHSWADTYRLGYAATPGAVVYHVSSFLEPENAFDYAPIEPLTASLKAQYLRLPPMDPRIPRLARDITAGSTTRADEANTIERYLRTNFGYTLTLPSEEHDDPLAYFLFERRKGHCEYFASSMAVLLRTLNIPSRVVTGFQSGVYNPISGWQLIRASDAHSWVEAYLPGRGWTVYDPTPGDPNAAGPSLWSHFALYLDAADVFWQDWVLSYDLDHQLLLASRMEESSRRVRINWLDDLLASKSNWPAPVAADAKRYGAIAFAVGAGLTLLIAFRRKLVALLAGKRMALKLRRGEAGAPEATLLYERMLHSLHRRGIEKPAWLTPAEFACVIGTRDIAEPVSELTRAYNQLRYGLDGSAAPRMIALLEQLEKS